MRSITSFFKIFPMTLLISHQAISSPLHKRKPTCQNVNIPITITATNEFIAEDFVLDPQTIIGSILNLIFTTFIPKTTFIIAARYCEPEVYVSGRQNTIQVLVHGATYTRNYCKFSPHPIRIFRS
jgi:hypothetical protein